MAKKTLSQATYADDNVQQLPVQVKGQASLVQQTFDKGTLDQKTYNNSTLLTELQSETLNDSGAHAIGLNTADTIANNVADELALIRQAGSGTIPPDGSITEPKLASDVQALLRGWTRPVTDNTIRIDELFVNEGISSIIGPDGETYYDYPESSKAFTSGVIDLTKAYCETVTQGTNNVSVTSMVNGVIGDFVVGQEITLQDDTSKEFLTIQSIADPVITFTSNIVNTYASGANVYRSNLVDESGTWKFGGFSASEVIDKTTPVQVVNQAYSTQGNGGRKQVVLDNGWLVQAMLNGTTQVSFYVSKDNGDTWSRLCYANYSSVDLDVAIATENNNIHAIYLDRFVSFDATTITDENVNLFAIQIDSSQTSFSRGVSIAINEFGGKDKITACLVTKKRYIP